MDVVVTAIDYKLYIFKIWLKTGELGIAMDRGNAHISNFIHI